MGNLYTSTTFMEHNSHPDYKYEMDAPTHEHDGINPSCGDELTLQLRVENGVIEEASFTGHGCAISQAACLLNRLAGDEVGHDVGAGLADGAAVAGKGGFLDHVVLDS